MTMKFYYIVIYILILQSNFSSAINMYTLVICFVWLAHVFNYNIRLYCVVWQKSVKYISDASSVQNKINNRRSLQVKVLRIISVRASDPDLLVEHAVRAKTSYKSIQYKMCKKKEVSLRVRKYLKYFITYKSKYFFLFL